MPFPLVGDKAATIYEIHFSPYLAPQAQQPPAAAALTAIACMGLFQPAQPLTSSDPFRAI